MPNSNGLIKNFDFNHQGALTSLSWSRPDRGTTSRSLITQMISRAQPYPQCWWYCSLLLGCIFYVVTKCQNVCIIQNFQFRMQWHALNRWGGNVLETVQDRNRLLLSMNVKCVWLKTYCWWPFRLFHFNYSCSNMHLCKCT